MNLSDLLGLLQRYENLSDIHELFPKLLDKFRYATIMLMLGQDGASLESVYGIACKLKGLKRRHS